MRDNEHPPFIQIVAGDRTTVYGLTASGDVYQWLGYFGELRWDRLGDTVHFATIFATTPEKSNEV